MRHRVTAASALGVLLIASPSYAHTGVGRDQGPTMTAQRQYTTATSARPRAAAEDTAIRPVPVHVPEEELVDLRRRIAATRWPEKETVADQSQGVQLATMQELARYWATDYDWRKVRGEAERPAAVHHRDRWAGHSLHSRSFEA